MAYAPSRSMNADLWAGATDGGYKKVINGRGGLPEATTAAVREDLYSTWYGITESPYKRGVCGKSFDTPGYLPAPPEPWRG